MNPDVTQILLAHGLIQDPGAVPLVLAVVGHRDPIPEIVPRLMDNFRRQLEQLIRTFPHTPLLMLNGLAEGIDSLSAEVFLQVMATDRQQRGVKAPAHQLVGALPKTPESYRDDFSSPGALARLERLLQHCDGLLHPDNCPDLDVPPMQDGHDRPHDDPTCYGQQGVFLVRHCYMLFAFYDGVETHLVGGTSQSVAMQRGEIHPLFVSVDEVLSNKEPGVLIVHQTPRQRAGSPQEGAGLCLFWNGMQPVQDAGIEIPDQLLSIPSRLEQINAAISAPGFKITERNEGPNTRLWSLADQKAGNHKGQYENICRVLVPLGLILVLFAQLTPAFASGLFWLLLLVAFVVFPKLQKAPKHRFISQRCLAECLSIQHIWICLSINDDAADLFHTRSNSELDWIRTVLRAVRIQLLSFHSRECRSPIAMNKAILYINEQSDYLQEKVVELKDKAQRWRLCSIIVAILSVLVALAQGLPTAPQGLNSWVVILIATFASTVAYSNLMGYAETADRYERSLRQFQRGQLGLKVAASDPALDPSQRLLRQSIVLEAIGREKLDELNDWVAGQLERVYAPGA